ncbi:MAG: DMT family transporter [Rubrivivax sp.]
MTEARARSRHAWAIAGLLFNAFAWGVSWWPLRELGERGLHPLWATAIVYAAGVLVIGVARPAAWRQLAHAPALAWLVLASGATNATFNWGVTIGDVVRVVLLFYLMPLWAVLLARWLLREPLTAGAALRLAMSLAGAAIVLWPADAAGSAGGARWPLPHTLAEWLGLAGGFAFALTNVLLRRHAAEPEAARALAMFLGGAVVATLLALALGGEVSSGSGGSGSGDGTGGRVPLPEATSAWLVGVALLSVWFVAANLAPGTAPRACAPT